MEKWRRAEEEGDGGKCEHIREKDEGGRKRRKEM